MPRPDNEQILRSALFNEYITIKFSDIYDSLNNITQNKIDSMTTIELQNFISSYLKSISLTMIGDIDIKKGMNRIMNNKIPVANQVL